MNIGSKLTSIDTASPLTIKLGGGEVSFLMFISIGMSKMLMEEYFTL